MASELPPEWAWDQALKYVRDSFDKDDKYDDRIIELAFIIEDTYERGFESGFADGAEFL